MAASKTKPSNQDQSSSKPGSTRHMNVSEGGTSSTRNAAESVKDAAESAAKGAGETLSKTASKAASVVEERADDAISGAEREARAFADRGKGQTEDVVRAFSRAFAAGRQSLEDDGMYASAGYLGAASSGLEKAADQVDGFDTGSITGRVEDFVRNRPMLTVGALAIAGFVVASAIKPKNRRG